MNTKKTTPKKRRWKKILGWGIGGLVLIVAGVIGTAVLLIDHSPRFRQRILAVVERSVEESTGARLQVRDFRLALSNLSLDLYGITVHGAESGPRPPLLQTDHISLEVKILSVLHQKWRLQDVVIDHPVLHLFVNKAGENNLPKSSQPSSSNTSIFDLAIQKLVLDRGEIYYNDRENVLDAELRDVNANVGFDNAQSRYYGDLGYRRGRIQYGTFTPLVHALQAHFDLTPARFTLDRLTLASGGSRISLKAAVDDYSNNPRMQASYDAVLEGGDFRRFLKDPTVPGGVVELNGSLKYQNDPKRPVLETVSLDGRISSRELAVKTPSVHALVRDLGAHYKLDAGNAEVEGIHAQLLGGSLEAKLVIHDLSGAARSRLQASVKNISLRDLAIASGNESSLREANVSGSVSASADAAWAKTLDNLVVHSDATMQGVLGHGGTPGSSAPLQGEIHADYRSATKQIALRQSFVKTPQTSVTLDGTVSTRSQLQVKVQSANLHELELLAANFSKPAPGQPPLQLGLYGTATLTAAVSGSLSAPQVAGQLAASNLQVMGSSWKVLRANLSGSPSQVHVSNGDLEEATQGHINFDVQVGLNTWAYSPSNPVDVRVAASQLSLADLERLAGQAYPVSGKLAANVSLHGSQLNPVGNGDINLTNAKVAGEPIQSLDLRFQGNGDAVQANLNIKLAAGSAQGRLTYEPKSEAYQVELQAANLRLEKLQTVAARNLQINGGLNLNASGRGTLKSPELTASLQIPTLQVQKQTISGITFNTHVHDRQADISLNSEAADTSLKANGTVGMDAPYTANVHLDTGRISFQPLLALYMPEQAGAVSGQTEVHASVQGPLADMAKVEAHVEIPVLNTTYNQFQLTAAKPIRLDYQNGVATLQPASIQGTGTDIQAQARVPVGNLKAASYVVRGKIDLALAQTFESDLTSSGRIEFDIDSQKSSSASGAEGQIRLVDGNVQSNTAPIGISHANGVITVTNQRMDVTSFQAEMGGGTINLKGGVTYRPKIEFSLGLSATNVRLRYPQGVRAVLGSTLALSGTPEAGVLNGQVRIEHISFTNDFDLSTFMDQFTEESAPPPTAGLAQNIKLNIALQSTSDVNLTSSQVSLQGSANLRVVGTVADPVILGRTDLTGGDLFFSNNRYVIQNGTIDFLNPTVTEPVVNLQVSTTINEYNITLHFQGPVDRLQTTYTSEPPLPPVDIINLVAFGQTTEAQTANPSPTGVAGGEALLAQGISSQVSGKLARAAGISSLSIDPGLGSSGSNTSNPGARIAIQQRFSGNLYVTFTTDVTSTQEQQIEVLYNLNPRWSIDTLRDQNGGIGVNAKYKKSF